MSFGHHTPESLLQRSDSKDPATTCKGLTTSGRPCRRALAATLSSPAAQYSNAQSNGIIAMLDDRDAAAFLCWQHKDQAPTLLARLSEKAQVLGLNQKSSIDTLMERMGVLELEDEVGNQYEERHSQRQAQANSDKRRQSQNNARVNSLPQEWYRTQGRVLDTTREPPRPQEYRNINQSSRPHRRHMSEDTRGSNVKASWSCCVVRTDDDDVPPPRRRHYRDEERQTPRRRTSHSRPRSYSSKPAIQSPHRYSTSSISTPIPRMPVHNPQMQQNDGYSTPNYSQSRRPVDDSFRTPTRPPTHQRPAASTSPPNPQTAAYLSLIPPHLAPATFSALLAELSKPISPNDEEGYIYIFWLTPETDVSKPDDETASSLLDFADYSPSPSPRRPKATHRERRPSELDRRQAKHALTAQALQRFASVKHGPAEPRKILLKIGRASNVHRRLSQWTKQCGQNITLIRYYPYTSGDATQSASASPNGSASGNLRRMVPHVHRVERLVHLELADQRVADKGRCEQCGREHKEWFEVEATREGVRAVDEVVRRWVTWAYTVRS